MVKRRKKPKAVRFKKLNNVDQVIAALGENQGLAQLTGKTTQHVSNWRKYGTLPKKFYIPLQRELTKLGYKAPPEIWGMTEGLMVEL